MRTLLSALSIVMLGPFSTMSALAQTKVTFGHQQVFDLAPVLIAQEKGFFARHGIEVVFKPVPLNSQNPAALESGEADIAMPTASVFLQAISGGLDHVANCGFSDTEKDDQNYGILVRPESNIRSPSDLIGKKVGVPGLNAFLHVMIREWLTIKGVDWRKVEFVETQFPLMEGALKSKSVDAVVGIQPFMARIMSANAGTLMSRFIREMPAEMSIALFSSTRSWAEKHPKEIKAYCDGFAEGAAYAREHQDEARAIVARFLKLPPPVVSVVAIPTFNSKLTENSIAPWVSIMKAQGMISGDIDVKKIIFR